MVSLATRAGERRCWRRERKGWTNKESGESFDANERQAKESIPASELTRKIGRNKCEIRKTKRKKKNECWSSWRKKKGDLEKKRKRTNSKE